ncbi:MAG: hypothetical protein Q8T13_23715 [Acidobacteriota bacterium]|nr:hypothetical protein [Acidobacteriota bacterium]
MIDIPLTVACVLVKGEYPYTPEYVRRLLAMVRRHLARPFRFVCLTDQPHAMPAGVEAVEVARLPECFALWTKLRLFEHDRAWGGRVLYLDLDTLIVAPLDPIVDYPAPFALAADELAAERPRIDTDRYGRRLVRRFNGSVMVWDAGTQGRLFDTWTPASAASLSTDQDWIGEQAHDAAGLPVEWFPRISRVQPPWPAEAKVVLVKKPKNHEAVLRWPWFDAAWGGQAQP